MSSRLPSAALAVTVVFVTVLSGCVGEEAASQKGEAVPAASPTLFEWNWTVAGSLDTQQSFPVFTPSFFTVNVDPKGAIPAWSIELRSAGNASVYYAEACDPGEGCRVSQHAAQLPKGTMEVALRATGEGTFHVTVLSRTASHQTDSDQSLAAEHQNT